MKTFIALNVRRNCIQNDNQLEFEPFDFDHCLKRIPFLYTQNTHIPVYTRKLNVRIQVLHCVSVCSGPVRERSKTLWEE